MSMPNDLIFIRHGESEANVMQALVKRGVDHAMQKPVYERPDWQQRLSKAGIEQARAAGRWFRQEFGDMQSFDLHVRSPFFRTRETSLYVANPDLDPADASSVQAADGQWINDDRLVERHWGMYGTLTLEEQRVIYPTTFDLNKRDPWYTALDGGESPAGGVRTRVRDFHATLHREFPGKRVVVVTHGEYMWTERQVIEYMLPEEWVRLDQDPAQRIRNCAVLHYTRVNPHNPDEIDEHLRWMRFVYTDAPDESPNGGEWMEITRKQAFTAAQTLEQLTLSPPLLTDVETTDPVEPWTRPQ